MYVAEAEVHVADGGGVLRRYLHIADDGGALDGTPVMDLFEDSTHAALKGALSACIQGRWSDHTLKVNAILTKAKATHDEILHEVAQQLPRLPG